MHADYPWDVALSWVVSVPVAPWRWRVLPRSHASCTDTLRVGSLSAGTGDVAWKPPFSSIVTLSRYRGPRPPRPYRATSCCAASCCAASYCAASYCAAPSTVTPTRGYRGVAPPSYKHFLVRTQSTPEVGQCPWPGRRPRPGRPPFLPSINFGQRPKTGRYSFQILYIYKIIARIIYHELYIHDDENVS